MVKRWAIRMGVGIALLLGVTAIFLIIGATDMAELSGYVKNENAPVLKDGWKGNPVDQKGRFMNDEFPYLPKATGILKWTLEGNPYKEEKQRDTARLLVRDPAEFLESGRDGILWLGHAGFFIRLNGVSILIDPVFGKPNFVTEYVSVPSPLERLPRVDYVLLSHDHRDHCDEFTLRSIAERFPEAAFLGGLGMDDLFSEWTTPTNRAVTTGWFQPFDLGRRSDGLEIYLVPVRHWSRRGLFDMNRRLWGGYIIKSSKATIYFGGDSGYGRHFREAGEVAREIDYFLIGIGAYEPRWFMEPNHTTPAEALQAFIDAGARTLVPMHYGRFDLSNEPPSHPLEKLKDEAARRGYADRVRPVDIYESIIIE
jgi:L-ascorbate metabolism protein UlaG (beta-lactamase superfamily)